MKAPDNLNDLHRLLKQQDPTAFGHFYDHYAGALFGEILRKVKDRSDSEEILLNVFVQAYRELPNASFEFRHLFTWMLVIVRSHIARYNLFSD